MKPQFLSARHPSYTSDMSYWAKWRRVAEGGDTFVNAYLVRLPGEPARDYDNRKLQTPAVSYVKMCIAEIIAAFMARMPGIARAGDAKSYIAACAGKDGGVDGFGSTMNNFMSDNVLRELLVTKRVGIYIDRADLGTDASIADAKMHPPYVYTVPAEDILAWTLKPGSLTPESLLLREQIPVYAENSPFVTGYKTGYRYLQQIMGMVQVDTYTDEGELIKSDLLQIPMLPFVLIEVSGPTVQDAAGAQIALLNLDSSSISFAIDSNLAVYTEQGDLTTMLAALRRSSVQDSAADDESLGDEDDDMPGTEADVQTIRLGRNRGRRYLKDSDRPGFVAPDNSNLQRSISFAGTLKDDIRRMMMLAVANITAKSISSATALIQGQVTANNGLATFGALFACVERTVSAVWGAFQEEAPADIIYPNDFQILTDEERRKAIDELAGLRDTVPSRTYQSAVTTQIARLLLSNILPSETLTVIAKEIEMAPGLVSRIEDIVSLVDSEIMPRQYAAECLCLPEDAAAKANAEHAERLRRMALSQASGTARGNTDGEDDSTTEKKLSQDPDLSDTGTRAVRS